MIRWLWLQSRRRRVAGLWEAAGFIAPIAPATWAAFDDEQRAAATELLEAVAGELLAAPTVLTAGWWCGLQPIERAALEAAELAADQHVIDAALDRSVARSLGGETDA